MIKFVFVCRRTVRSGFHECMVCGPLRDPTCLASDSEMPTIALGGGQENCAAVHSICSLDDNKEGVWRGSDAVCEPCTLQELGEGKCSASCRFPLDSVPPGVANAVWGIGANPCQPDMVLRPGENCAYACPTGYAAVSPVLADGSLPPEGTAERASMFGSATTPYATCSLTDDSQAAMLQAHGQCIPTTCVDNSAEWSTDFHKTVTVLDATPKLINTYTSGCGDLVSRPGLAMRPTGNLSSATGVQSCTFKRYIFPN